MDVYTCAQKLHVSLLWTLCESGVSINLFYLYFPSFLSLFAHANLKGIDKVVGRAVTLIEENHIDTLPIEFSCIKECFLKKLDMKIFWEWVDYK